MTLTVESVDLVPILIVKTLLWEVLPVAINLNLNRLVVVYRHPILVFLGDAHHFFESQIPLEVVVSIGVVAEEVDEELNLRYPAARDEWIHEHLIHHG